MLRHVVLFTWSPEADDRRAQVNRQQLARGRREGHPADPTLVPGEGRLAAGE